jgi:hypothetical protein
MAWRHGHGYMAWRHGHGDMAWRHGHVDIELKYRGILMFSCGKYTETLKNYVDETWYDSGIVYKGQPRCRILVG